MFSLRRYAEYRRSHFGEATAKRNNSLGTPGGSTPPLPTIFCYDVFLFFLFFRQRPEWYLQNLLFTAPSARTAHLHMYGILISYFFTPATSRPRGPQPVLHGQSRRAVTFAFFPATACQGVRVPTAHKGQMPASIISRRPYIVYVKVYVPHQPYRPYMQRFNISIFPKRQPIMNY